RTIAGQTTPATVPEPGLSGSVKSRKENAQESPLPRDTVSEGNNLTSGASQLSSAISAAGHKRQRVVTPASVKAEGNNLTSGASQLSSAISAAGHKRQRVVTPASVKAIDQEDEPKNSIMRKISQGSAGRRALGELPNAL
ncbi:hypothetical protein V491_03285, partial [Pseudogymnoascus sp. VKM F-3775]